MTLLRKLQKIGNSQFVSIPKVILESLEVNEGETIRITVEKVKEVK